MQHGCTSRSRRRKRAAGHLGSKGMKAALRGKQDTSSGPCARASGGRQHAPWALYAPWAFYAPWALYASPPLKLSPHLQGGQHAGDIDG
jgi:hypothetical protein